jgi:hypothetical protein
MVFSPTLRAVGFAHEQPPLAAAGKRTAALLAAVASALMGKEESRTRRVEDCPERRRFHPSSDRVGVVFACLKRWVYASGVKLARECPNWSGSPDEPPARPGSLRTSGL